MSFLSEKKKKKKFDQSNEARNESEFDHRTIKTSIKVEYGENEMGKRKTIRTEVHQDGRRTAFPVCDYRQDGGASHLESCLISDPTCQHFRSTHARFRQLRPLSWLSCRPDANRRFLCKWNRIKSSE